MVEFVRVVTSATLDSFHVKLYLLRNITILLHTMPVLEYFLADYLIGHWVKFHLNKELIYGVKAERFINQFQVGQKLSFIPKGVPMFVL